MESFKLLVVDDEPGIRAGIKRVLKKFTVDYPFMDEAFGFDVDEVPTGEEAIEYLKKYTPDIILLDNKLPGIQGIDVLEFINKSQIRSFVVMITSYASLDLAVSATKNGAFDFVPKPFTPQELRSSMENVSKQLFLKRMTAKMHKEGKQIRFQFLSLLSHELKAPINAVESYLNMMKDRELGTELKDYDQIITRSISRMQEMRNLILDLLDLTRLESDKKVSFPERCHLNSIIKEILDAWQPFAIQKEVNIHFDVKEDVYLIADIEELRIVFNNLISNGIKYNKQGGDLSVRMETNEQKVKILVKDTGIGIASEDQEKLFHEFVRIKNETTKHISGSGLGLSIVKRIIDKYQADITVFSELNIGSVFTITFDEIDF
jgi:two-component system, sensor histidine kinase and response regulator